MKLLLRMAAGPLAAAALIAAGTAFRDAPAPRRLASASATADGITFNLRITFHATRGSDRDLILLAHGSFVGDRGRIDIDTVTGAATFRKGDFFVMRDTIGMVWGRPADNSLRDFNSPIQNPLEGIAERAAGATQSLGKIRIDFDTIGAVDTIDNRATRHYRTTADHAFDARNNTAVIQRIVIDQWVTALPMRIRTPFSARVRGVPTTIPNGEYSDFIKKLIAANAVFGDAVAVKTVTTTIYVVGTTTSEFVQTVELLDIKLGPVDESRLGVPPGFIKRPPD